MYAQLDNTCLAGFMEKNEPDKLTLFSHRMLRTGLLPDKGIYTGTDILIEMIYWNPGGWRYHARCFLHKGPFFYHKLDGKVEIWGPSVRN